MSIIKESHEKVKDFIEKKRLDTEVKRQAELMQSKLDSEALAQRAKEARTELKTIKQTEKDQADIDKLRDYRLKNKPDSKLQKAGKALDTFADETNKALDSISEVANRFEIAHDDKKKKDLYIGGIKVEGL